MARMLLPGRPYPLGAKPNFKEPIFALYSENASSVWVCLFDENGEETDCVELKEHTPHLSSTHDPRGEPRQRYGYRVDGPWDPENGLRFNRPNYWSTRMLKAICGNVDWKKPIFPYDLMSGDDTKKDDQGLGCRRSEIHCGG